jgi:hypothetical protein
MRASFVPASSVLAPALALAQPGGRGHARLTEGRVVIVARVRP